MKTRSPTIDTLPAWRTYPSLSSAASDLQIPAGALSAAKRAGCPAFKFSRVDSFELLRWLLKRSIGSERGAILDFNFEKARLTKEQADEMTRLNRIADGTAMDAADVRDYVTNCFRPIQETIRPMADVLAPLTNPADREHARQHLDAWVTEFYNRINLPHSEIVASKSEPKDKA